MLRKGVNDVDIKVAAYKILHPYQWDADHARCLTMVQPVSSPTEAVMTMA